MPDVARAAARPDETAAPPARRPLPWLFLVAAGLVALVVAVYGSALNHDFVDWDDMQYVVENPLVLGKQYGALLHSAVARDYHPLTLVSMAWNVETPLSARPFIATNIALHVFDTLLVLWLTWLLSGGRLAVAGLVALLFGIHPMHVESVAWVSTRKDVLFAFFFLAGLIAYWKYLERRRPGWLALTLVLFVLSCLSKQVAAMFPGVMILLDLWRGRRPWEPRALLEKLPFVALALLFTLIRLDVQTGGDFHGLLSHAPGRQETLPPVPGMTPLHRAILPAWAYMMYMVRLLVPLGLSAFYPYPSPDEINDPRYLLGPVVLIGTLVLAWWGLRRARVVSFGIAWYLVTMLPVLKWVPVGSGLMNDRYTYLPYLGLFFVLATGLEAARMRSRRLGTVLWAATGVWVVCLVAITAMQVETWKDTETLWTRTIRIHPRYPSAYLYRGKHRALTGQTAAAMADFQTALGLGLRNADVYEGLGTSYGTLGRLDSAVVMFDRALAVDPERGMIYYNRGITRLGMGQARGALADIDQAIRLMPERIAALSPVRGYALMELGDARGALACFDRALTAGPDDPAVRYARGSCRLRLGDKAGAADDFRATLRMNPGNTDARAQLEALGR